MLKDTENIIDHFCANSPVMKDGLHKLPINTARCTISSLFKGINIEKHYYPLVNL